jgi:hypothetical protein
LLWQSREAGVHEMAGVYTLDSPFQAAPSNLLTLANVPIRKQMHRTYRETITINSQAS